MKHKQIAKEWLSPSIGYEGMTMMEILVIIIIIGILAALAVPNFGPARESALDREAQAALRLLQAAQRIYRMEAGRFYPFNGGTQSDIATINADLRLALRTVGNLAWDYQVESGGAVATYCAQASRTAGGPARSWSIRQSQADPANNGCP